MMLRILIVDDDFDVRHTLSLMLQRSGRHPDLSASTRRLRKRSRCAGSGTRGHLPVNGLNLG
jgi:CheY-like chemotaxis protein